MSSHHNLVLPQPFLLPVWRHQSLGPLQPQSPQNLVVVLVVVALVVVVVVVVVVAVMMVLAALLALVALEALEVAVALQAPHQSLSPLQLQSPQKLSRPRPKLGALADPTGCIPARG